MTDDLDREWMPKPDVPAHTEDDLEPDDRPDASPDEAAEGGEEAQ